MTFSEALRFSIRKACKPSSKAEKEFWNTIEKVWERNKKVDLSKIESEVNKAIS